jgi:transcriptional regulator with XRE-family HTH domain
MNQIAEIIGRRLRARRRLMGLTQAAVGEACGLTFQQIHKYETGLMMIPASRLWKLSGALGVPVGYFFEGLPAGPGTAGLPGDTAQAIPSAVARAAK